jgi:hypothetical protein
MLMVAFLPMWILGALLVLALIAVMATRSSGSSDVDHDAPRDRNVGTAAELRRGEESSPVAGESMNHYDTPANIS